MTLDDGSKKQTYVKESDKNNMSEDKKLNEVIRVKKRPSNFVMMDKTFLEDDRLSYKAKGLLAYLLSKPDDWKVIVGNLVNSSKDGKASVYAGLKELKECGYYEKVPVRNEQGTRIIRWESTVYEVSISLLTDFQEVDNQDKGNLYQENRERNNNYYTNNNITNNYNTSLSINDGTSQLNKTLDAIHENIGYEQFKQTYPGDIGLIDEFVNVMLDVLLSEGGVIRINGEVKSRELVQSQIVKLEYADVEYVLMQFKQQKERIKKKSQYILSMLYQSRLERNAHYTNWVQSNE